MLQINGILKFSFWLFFGCWCCCCFCCCWYCCCFCCCWYCCCFWRTFATSSATRLRTERLPSFNQLDLSHQQFTKQWAFAFPLAEMRQHIPSLIGATFTVSASVTDWYFIETKTAKAYSVVYSHKTHIRFLGGSVRVFKPGSPINVFVSPVCDRFIKI